MDKARRNIIGVTLFLFGTVGFTVLMTFYAGPRVMGMREEVVNRDLLFKTREILDGERIRVQQRAWERPNEYPLYEIRLAGVDAPPLRDAEDPDLIAWAQRHGVSPVQAARMAHSAQRTLVAFIRNQNAVMKPADGRDIREVEKNGLSAHLFVGGTDVGRKQLLQGLSAHRRDGAQLEAEIYAAAEAEARREKRGLWAD
ncbi:MAG: thermonuclease family protein [Verrucomicrobia bacterium]|nr:thermonuclease family protein [Verrucomicrobiota bacterium]MCH8528534.1 thermonuclease family protein [Kiritimatiellia bacterium]